MEPKYPESVAALRAELTRLEGELRAADDRSDRRGALNVLARMLQLQQRFMQKWARTSTPRGTPTTAAASADADESETESASPHGDGRPDEGR